MQLTRQDKLFIVALYATVAGIVMLQLLGLNSLVSALFTLTFFLVALLWTSTAMRRVTSNDLLAWLIVIVAFIHVFADAWISGSSLSFSYLKKWVMFSASVLYLATVSKLRADRKIMTTLLRLNTLVAVYLILFFVLRRDVMYELNGVRSQYLTFRFTNPNLTGLFLTCIVILETVCLQESEAWWRKMFRVALCAVLVYFIFLTGSRSAQLAVFGFFLLAGWLVLRRRSYAPLPKWLLTLVAVFPLLFALLYLSVVHSSWLSETFSFLVREGKALTNRRMIWQRAFRAFLQAPVFGSYSALSHGTGSFQMHNTHLDVLTSYGLSVLIAVCVLLYRLMQSKNTGVSSSMRSMFLIGFIGALMLGNGEAALFSGGLGIYLLAGSFLLLANSLPEESNHEAGVSQQLFQSSSKTAF